MEYRIQFHKQSLAKAPDPFEAEVRTAKGLLFAISATWSRRRTGSKMP